MRWRLARERLEWNGTPSGLAAADAHRLFQGSSLSCHDLFLFHLLCFLFKIPTTTAEALGQ